mgnify:CR=1 FL=1
MGDVDNGGTVHVSGQGIYGKCLSFLVSFVVNLELLLKIKSIGKKSKRIINR